MLNQFYLIYVYYKYIFYILTNILYHLASSHPHRVQLNSIKHVLFLFFDAKCTAKKHENKQLHIN